MIATATRLTKGSGGPSQLDAEQFRHIILSKKFKKESKDLREQMVLLPKKLAATLVHPKSIETFVAFRLIALKKNPGVRPIGVGEILRRIIGHLDTERRHTGGSRPSPDWNRIEK